MVNSECKQHRPEMEGAFKDAPAKPLSAITDSIEGLVKIINTNKKMKECEELRLDVFCDASILVSFLFRCLGLAFKFAELEYVAKVRDLAEASKTLETLPSMIDQDIANRTVKVQGSHSRNLRRVRQGLDLIRALFEQFLKTNDYSLKEAASTAYARACAPYHTWAVRAAVAAALYTLPTRDQLLLKLNETRPSVEIKMRRYIDASTKLIEYIDKLYTSRNIGLDW